MHKYYLLVGKEIQECSMTEFAEFLNKPERVLQQDRIHGPGAEEILVSTVFLGLDHSFGGEGPPVLFETMVFGGTHNDYQDRYCTYDEALAGHKETLAMVTTSISTFQPVDILKGYEDELAKRINLNLN